MAVARLQQIGARNPHPDPLPDLGEGESRANVQDKARCASSDTYRGTARNVPWEGIKSIAAKSRLGVCTS